MLMVAVISVVAASATTNLYKSFYGGYLYS